MFQWMLSDACCPIRLCTRHLFTGLLPHRLQYLRQLLCGLVLMLIHFLFIKSIAITMETTIQLNKQTVQVLKDMKKKSGMKSYDELINSLIRKQKKTSKSMFGSNPRLDPFTEEERFTDREYP